ncbi:nitrilase-related carbon-nitrogen hydrolase [Streptomyces sp. NPDC055078]
MSTPAGARRELRVALAQLTPHPADIAADLARLEDIVGAHPEAELIVFPELFLGGYRLDSVREVALDPHGEVMGRVRAVAARWRTAVVVGFTESVGTGGGSALRDSALGDGTGGGGALRGSTGTRTDTGGVANSLACVDSDGSLVDVYRKTHLFDREREHFAAGDRLGVVELAGVRVGPLICFDIEFPEPARTLALDGAQLLVGVAANMEPYEADHELASRARALDNRLPLVYVNRTGRQAPYTFTGRSRVVAPDGSVVLQLGPDEDVVCARVPVGAASGEPTDYLRLLRPDLYGGRAARAASR